MPNDNFRTHPRPPGSLEGLGVDGITGRNVHPSGEDRLTVESKVISPARMRLILRRIGSGFYGRSDIVREVAIRLLPTLNLPKDGEGS